jgi:hypothetical protein
LGGRLEVKMSAAIADRTDFVPSFEAILFAWTISALTNKKKDAMLFL